MAQFVPLGVNVEVLGQSIFSVVNAISLGKESRLEILKKKKVLKTFVKINDIIRNNI
jgi:hypothetical protein